MEPKKMAIIKKVGYGCRDVGKPVLFFTTYIRESFAALQILEGKDATNFIKAYQVYDVKDLEGKPVWVIEDGISIKIEKPCIM